MIPTSESQSVVWTTEMAEAFGIAGPLIADGDRIAARMAFKEAYARLVAKARDKGRPVDWSASLGHDPRSRDAVLAEAVAKGRLPYEHAQQFSPALPRPDLLALQ